MKFTYTDRRLIADRNYQLVKDCQKGQLQIRGAKESSKLFLKEEQVRVIDPNSEKAEKMGLAEVPKINLSIINVGETIELLPDGASVEVVFSNRLEYLRLLRERIVEDSTKQTEKQYQHFLRGFAAVVDPRLLRRFSADELRDLIEGSSHISGKN